MNKIELKADTDYTVEPYALGFDIQPIKPEAGDVLALTFDRAPERWAR